MRTLRLIFLTCLPLLASMFVYAQNQWHYLPNNGFSKGYNMGDSSYRIEDMYFTDFKIGYAVTLTNRILKTSDGGINWMVQNDIFDYGGFRAVEFLDDDSTGIVGSLNDTGKVYRTTNAGSTWLNISANIPDTTTKGRKRICGISHTGDNVYAVGWWGGTTAKFHKSTDKGLTWQTTYLDSSLATGLVDVHFFSADTGFACGTRDLTGKPSVSVILKTTNGGNNWTEVFSDTVLGGYIWKLQFLNNSDVAVGSIENLYYKDSVNMVYSTDRGNTWMKRPVGTRTPTINFGGGTQAVGFATPAKGWVGGYYDGIFETTDSGKTWTHLAFGYDFNRIFVLDSNNIFAGGHMPYVYSNGKLSVGGTEGKSKLPHKLYPVSPNPAKDKIDIRFELYNETNVVLRVIHVDTRTVFTVTNTHLAKGVHSFSWDATNAPAGNYFIWLGNNEIPITEKFVLLK